MTSTEIESAAITALIIAVPVLIVVSYWIYLINKETYQDIDKNDKK